MDYSSIIDSMLGYCQQTDEDDYYKIMGCSPSANRSQILAEYRIKAKLYHPDKILQNESVISKDKKNFETKSQATTPIKTINLSLKESDKDQIKPSTNEDNEKMSSKICTQNEQFKRIVEAKEVLCDEGRRREYDRWRESGLSMSWKTWKALLASSHKTHSMHWARTKKGPDMITHNTTPCTGDSELEERMTSEELIRRFRNYEI